MSYVGPNCPKNKHGLASRLEAQINNLLKRVTTSWSLGLKLILGMKKRAQNKSWECHFFCAILF